MHYSCLSLNEQIIKHFHVLPILTRYTYYKIDTVPGTGHCAEKDDQSLYVGVGHRQELITGVIWITITAIKKMKNVCWLWHVKWGLTFIWVVYDEKRHSRTKARLVTEASRGKHHHSCMSGGLWVRAPEKDKEKTTITSFIRHFTLVNMA